MAFTTSDIDALKSALSSGALRVRYPDGREVQYRSLAEIRDILRMAETEASGSSPRSRTTVAGF